MITAIVELSVTVDGRPAPQGSKATGAAGQLREASVYLPAWRAAVKRAMYERYKALGVMPADLPLFRGPVRVEIAFRLGGTQRPDSPPDLDKLQRAVWDALTQARAWEDDGRVVDCQARKDLPGDGAGPGADIRIRSAGAMR